jgi:hypothetical protein
MGLDREWELRLGGETKLVVERLGAQRESTSTT